MVDTLIRLFPSDYMDREFYSPFLGGGALELRNIQRNSFPSQVWNDLNPHLITLYRQLLLTDQYAFTDFIAKVQAIETLYNGKNVDGQKAMYKKIREEFNSASDPAKFLFLNKTCFNGVYRENKKGEFNVFTNHGSKGNTPKKIALLDYDNVIAIRHKVDISQVKITHGHFGSLRPHRDVFAYLDPPYYSKTSTLKYIGGQKLDEVTLRVFGYCSQLHEVGAKFMLSNVNDPFVTDLFSDYNVIELQASRKVSSNGDRKPANEVIITNYETTWS